MVALIDVNYEKLTLILLISIFALGGCVAPATSIFHYKTNDQITVNNEKLINKPFETVWDELVRELAKSFFVINNVSKESRLMNVSFSSAFPEKYIDCGISARTFTDSQGQQKYNYAVAEDSSYKVAGESQPPFSFVHNVQRKTNLEGRINVYVAPEGGNTLITVNARYVFTVVTSGHTSTHNLYGQVMGRDALPSSIYTQSFNTNELSKDSDGAVCFATGVLEKEILDVTNLN